MVLTPLLLQGWIPEIATFLNTPAWTMSAECSYYVLFPWLASWKRPKTDFAAPGKMAGVWFLGMIPGALYIAFNPTASPILTAGATGPWLQALKYTPYTHLASFVFGVMLASVDEMMPRKPSAAWLGLAGFAGLFGLLEMGPLVPYALIHDGLLMPLFGCIILGLAGENLLSYCFGLRPLVFVGEASYCLYLLHFTMWNLCFTTRIYAGPAAPGPVRSVDQLRDPDWHGAGWRCTWWKSRRRFGGFAWDGNSHLRRLVEITTPPQTCVVVGEQAHLAGRINLDRKSRSRYCLICVSTGCGSA
jgi:peptidoglycan/LPS O-acetylase OafA/YrhL